MTTGEILHFDGLLHPLEGTDYCLINRQISQSSELFEYGTDYFDVNDINDSIEAIETREAKRMKVVFDSDTSFYIRTSFDETTLFKSVGTAIQDFEVANRIYNKSITEKFGEEIRLYE